MQKRLSLPDGVPCQDQDTRNAHGYLENSSEVFPTRYDPRLATLDVSARAGRGAQKKCPYPTLGASVGGLECI